MDFKLQAVEVSKMLKRLNQAEIDFSIHCTKNGIFEIVSEDEEVYVCGERKESLYDVLKDFYFQVILGQIDTEMIDISLDDDVYQSLIDEANKRNMIIDELAIELLSDYIDKLSEKQLDLKL
jgi:hypothetical protein